jgi:subtilisin family serine protease
MSATPRRRRGVLSLVVGCLLVLGLLAWAAVGWWRGAPTQDAARPVDAPSATQAATTDGDPDPSPTADEPGTHAGDEAGSAGDDRAGGSDRSADLAGLTDGPGVAVPEQSIDALVVDGEAPVIAALALPGDLAARPPVEREALVAAATEDLLADLPEGSYGEVTPLDLVGAIAVTVDGPGLRALRTAAAVEAIEPDVVHRPTSMNAPITVGADDAWADGADGSGRIVAVLDTGVDASHPYLGDGGTSKVVAEACFTAGTCPNATGTQTGAGAAAPCTNPPFMTACQHGTHVAGIAAGGMGLPLPSGYAPEANLIAIQVFTQTDSDVYARGTDIIQALGWLYSVRGSFPGLSAVNLSLGGATPYPPGGSCDLAYGTTKQAIDLLRSVGIATVISTGNDSWRGAISGPGCISTAIAVASVNDTTMQLSDFSNISSDVELLAPGSFITSSWPEGTPDAFPVSQWPGGDFGSMSGTSMAAPVISGALAVLAEVGPTTTVDQRIALLTQMGTPINAAGIAVRPYVQLDASVDALVAGQPLAPTSVVAWAGNGQAVASWQAPSNAGRAPVTSYQVTASPGGRTCTTAATSCTVTGLTNGTPHTLSVRAVNVLGAGPAAGSDPVTPDGTLYAPLVPARLMDTRVGAPYTTVDGQARGQGALGPGAVRSLQVAGRGGVPASGAGAVALNVTATGASRSSFLTLYPSGSPRPNASNLNFVGGQTVPNMVIAQVGADGKVDLYNAEGSVDVLVDVLGWFPQGAAFTPLVPARLLESRTDPGLATVDGQHLGTGRRSTQRVTVVGRGGVPASGVGAVAINVTVTRPDASGFATVHPAGTLRPNASNLNYVPGQTVANMVVAKVGDGGMVDIDVPIGSADVIVDVLGWFVEGPALTSLSPARLMDTRSGPGIATVDGQALAAGPLAPGETRWLRVTGRGGVPATGAGAVVLNVTATVPSIAGFLTIHPAGTGAPTASNLNFVGGQTVPNMVIARVGDGGQVAITNPLGSTHVIVDVLGYLP